MDFKGKNVLIAYFSKKGSNWAKGGVTSLTEGNTEKMAKLIQKYTGGTLFEIESVTPYPDEYYACCDAAKKEKDEEKRPVLKKVMSAVPYDIVFVGFPCWWGTAPMPVFSYLNVTKWEGKSLAPFGTSEGSGFGTSIEDIEINARHAKVLKGLNIIGSKVDESESQIKAWLEAL